MKTEKEYIELLKQYHIRPLSREELQELLEWLDSQEGEQACYRYFDELMETPARTCTNSDKVRRRIINRMKKRISFRRLLRYKRRWLGAAAAIFLLLGSGWIYLQERLSDVQPEEIIVHAKEGNKDLLTLADGSKVWLNEKSALSYSADNVRCVYLEGEAYFEVAKNQQQCFEVHTPYGVIKVYGTSFNVKAHKCDSLFTVSLVEGSIGLKMNHLKKEMRLHPDEMVCYNQKNNFLQLTNADMTNAGIWRERELKLRDENIATLWDKMAHWYGMEFHIEKWPSKNHLYNVTIQTESVENMLELISAITPIEYVIRGKEVTVKYK